MWSKDEVFDLQKMALAIKENTETVLERVLAKHDEMMRATLSRQEELSRIHHRLVERLTDVTKRDSTFLFAVIGTMLVFAVIYLLK